MSEAAWQGRITDLCDLLGLRWHHETDSRRSKEGFPDLVIVGNTVLFAELKAEKGKTTEAQMAWMNSLDAAKIEAYVWRPSDWPEVYYRLHRLAGRRALPLEGAVFIR